MVRAPDQYPVPASLAWAVVVIGFGLSVVIAVGVGLLFIVLYVLSTLRSLASSLMVSDVAVVVADFAHVF